MQVAHRAYYEERYGPLPSGVQLDHLCRTPACVNPEHLEPVSARINTLRGVRTKLSDADVAALRSMEEATIADVAQHFGISISYATALRRGTRRVVVNGVFRSRR
jgi:hypothetical protein